MTDGEYDLRAVATDVHSNTRTSTSVMTTVQNSAGVVLDPVVGPVRGTVTLTGRIVNATGSATIAFQASTSGANSWFEIPGCGAAAGLVRTCQVDTTSITGYYDWRAVGVVNGNTYYDYRVARHRGQHRADHRTDGPRRSAERDREHVATAATRTAASPRSGSSTAGSA